MTVAQADLIAKGEAVRDKAVEKWIEAETGGIEAAFNPAAALPQVEAAMGAQFDFIVDMFRDISYRDPASLDAMITDLDNAHLTLGNPVTENVDTVKGSLADWSGEAAESFELNYLTGLPAINSRQREFVNTLKVSLSGVKTMLENSRSDTMTMGDTAIAKLDALEQPSPLSLILTVAGAAASLFPPTATLFTAISAGTAIGSAAVSYEQQSISGEDVASIVYSMCESYIKMIEAMETIELSLSDALAAVMSNVAEVPHWYRPPMPDIAEYAQQSKSERGDTRGQFEPG